MRENTILWKKEVGKTLKADNTKKEKTKMYSGTRWKKIIELYIFAKVKYVSETFSIFVFAFQLS